MFGNDSQPSVMWQYGAPVGVMCNAELVREQMWLAHRYRNDLVAHERERRELVAAALHTRFPDLAAIQDWLENVAADIEAQSKAIKQASSKARSRVKGPSKEQRDELAALRWHKSELAGEYKAVKKTCRADPALKAALAEIDAASAIKAKELRAKCGVFWGTYLTVEQSLQGMRSGAPPKFKAWRGDGKLAVQLQGGATEDELRAGDDARLRIEMLPAPFALGEIVRPGCSFFPAAAAGVATPFALGEIVRRPPAV